MAIEGTSQGAKQEEGKDNVICDRSRCNTSTCTVTYGCSTSGVSIRPALGHAPGSTTTLSGISTVTR